VPGSFVDAALAYRHSDLLYSLTWRDRRDTLIYLLFEHQSKPPTHALMGERLHSYLARIWERWRADHPEAKKLPMILPVVLYHGAAAWTEPVAFEDSIDVPAGMRPYIDPLLVRLTYVLHDLSQITDEQLRAGAMRTARGKLAMLLLKHGRTDANIVQLLWRWMDVVREIILAPHGMEALAQLMRYLCEVSDHVELDELQDLLEREIGPEAKEAIMTLGQRLIEQGRQQGIEQGIEQGRQQGIEQGIEQGRQQILLVLLRQRFGDAITPQVEQRVATASGTLLEAWTGRVLSAATLAELLGE
jgi:hypothetical protein